VREIGWGVATRDAEEKLENMLRLNRRTLRHGAQGK